VIPSFPKLTFPLDEKQIELLSKSLAELRDLLTGHLTTNENTTSQILDIPFQAPDSPSIGMPAKPMGVTAIAFETSAGTSTAMANPLQWSWSGGRLTIPSLAGLAGSTKYVLRVRIERG
jgi:hypothetical protein